MVLNSKTLPGDNLMSNLTSLDGMIRAAWRLPMWSLVAKAVRLVRSPGKQDWIDQLQLPGPGSTRLDSLMQAARPGLVASAALMDITPPDPSGMYLAGFAAQRTCTGVLDPLYARTLFISDGETPLIIVALDLIGLSGCVVDKLRDCLTGKFQDSLLIVSTHNHQGPDTLGLWGKSLGGWLPYQTGVSVDYMNFLVDRIVACVEQALDAAQPARLHVAKGVFDSQARWIHNERDNLVDRDLRVIQFDDLQGRSIATLMQHACHPETLWKANRKMSADFCGECCGYVEKQIGGVGLYVNGALGAMLTAAIDRDSRVETRQTFMVDLGRALGRAAVRLVRRARQRPPADPEVNVAACEVRMPPQANYFYALMQSLGVVAGQEDNGEIVSQVSFYRVGPASITCLPGEPAPAVGLEILKRVPGNPKLLFGLANDELGYLVPPEFFHDDKYAYESSLSPGPLAAARIALAIEKLARLEQ